MTMFHFNGTWLDLFYTCFFLLGVIWTGLLLLIAFVAILSNWRTKSMAKDERKRVMDMLDPEKRKQKVEELLKDTNEKLKDIKKEEEKDERKKGK